MNDPAEGTEVNVTQLIRAVREGDEQAADQLLTAVYRQLRQMAAANMAKENPGHTLQTTALVHEAWLRLGNARFENRSHFFGAAAEAMRRILVDRARRKKAAKHGGGMAPCTLDGMEIAAPSNNEEVLAVHEALGRLAAQDARKAELVKLRYFAGLTFEECAALLGVSVPTAKRDWSYAREWLHREISGGV